MRDLRRKSLCAAALAALVLLAAGPAAAGTSWYIGIHPPGAMAMPAPPVVVYPSPPGYVVVPAPVYPPPSRVVVVPAIQLPPPVALRIEHVPGPSHYHDDDCDDD